MKKQRKKEEEVSDAGVNTVTHAKRTEKGGEKQVMTAVLQLRSHRYEYDYVVRATVLYD